MNLLVGTSDGLTQSVPVSTRSTLTVDDGAGTVQVFSFDGLVVVELQLDSGQQDGLAEPGAGRARTARRRKPHTTD